MRANLDPFPRAEQIGERKCREIVRQRRAEQIGAAIHAGLAKVSRQAADIREVATIDLKAQEPGLRQWCEQHEVPVRIFSRSVIAARPWATEPSAWVEENAGVVGVCEPCALVATIRGRLILPKTALDGVAVAIVEDEP